MATVKCIKIDSKNEVLRYENLDAREVSKHYREEKVIRNASCNNAETVVIYFDDSTIEDPKEIPRHGIFLWAEALQTRFKKKNYTESKCLILPIIGDAIIVSYVENIVDGEGTGAYTAIDTTIAVETAERLVVNYSSGVETFLPEFTCIVVESVSQPGYEVLLRLENEGGPQTELDKPIRCLSSQVVTFALAGRELIVMTGRISSLDEKVHVGIYESDRSDMRCAGACTLAANKISGWVKNRLEDFFFNRIITEPFMDELNFRRSMDETHRLLGID